MSIDWNSWWNNHNTNELINVDFFDGRQYVFKYLPFYGKIIEAGCGSGRYVIYLAGMGLDILGIDIADKALNMYRLISKKFDTSAQCAKQDIRKTDFPDNYFSAYLSFGVIEHFAEGPSETVREAYRILKPGGIAIITTPNKYSLPNIYFSLMRLIRLSTRKILGIFIKRYRPEPRQPDFFQYWYSRQDLINFMRKAGFDIAESNTIGLLDSIWYLIPHTFKKDYIKYCFVNKYFSTSIFKIFGLHSTVVCVKPGDFQHCFVCGGLAKTTKIRKIPFCEKCMMKYKNSLVKYLYKKAKPNYKCSIPILPKQRQCYFCRKYFKPLYLDFSQSICGTCRGGYKNFDFRRQLEPIQYKYIDYPNEYVN